MHKMVGAEHALGVLVPGPEGRKIAAPDCQPGVQDDVVLYQVVLPGVDLDADAGAYDHVAINEAVAGIVVQVDAARCPFLDHLTMLNPAARNVHNQVVADDVARPLVMYFYPRAGSIHPGVDRPGIKDGQAYPADLVVLDVVAPHPIARKVHGMVWQVVQ